MRNNPPDEITLYRNASRFATLPDAERRERIHLAAWRTVCHAQARRFVREVALVQAIIEQPLHGYGRTYGEKLSEQEGGHEL